MTAGGDWRRPILYDDLDWRHCLKLLGGAAGAVRHSCAQVVEAKNTGGSVVAICGYDDAHRRVTKLTGSTTRHYYYLDRW